MILSGWVLIKRNICRYNLKIFYRMMARTNFTGSGYRTESYRELVCSPTLVGGLQQYTIAFSAVNILLSLTAFLGNALILVALHTESSLHPPSKLLYRCLATTDLFVGLVVHPLAATYLMSLVHKDWSLCRYTYDAVIRYAAMHYV